MVSFVQWTRIFYSLFISCVGHMMKSWKKSWVPKEGRGRQISEAQLLGPFENNCVRDTFGIFLGASRGHSRIYFHLLEKFSENYLNFFQYVYCLSIFFLFEMIWWYQQMGCQATKPIQIACVANTMLITGKSVASSMLQWHCPGKRWSYSFTGLGGKPYKIMV